MIGDTTFKIVLDKPWLDWTQIPYRLMTNRQRFLHKKITSRDKTWIFMNRGTRGLLYKYFRGTEITDINS